MKTIAVWACLAVASPALAQPATAGRAISDAAITSIGTWSPHCGHHVVAVLGRAGIRPTTPQAETASELYAWSSAQGWNHQDKWPTVGDLAFLGTGDAEHVGVVTAVDTDGTVMLVHADAQHNVTRINLFYPQVERAGGRVVNDPVDGVPAATRWLAFASIPSPVSPPVANVRTRPLLAQPLPPTSALVPEDSGQVLLTKVVRGRRLQPADLDLTDCYELWIARNAVVGRHGYAFRTPELQRTFASEGWYRRIPRVNDATIHHHLTEIDRSNLGLLDREERARRCR